MPTTYTSLIGLALPTTGELTGTWGTVVNDYITRYLDAAIAGTQTLSTDADVTLTVTNGSNLGATSAQYAILNCTGARTVQRTITVPAASKSYLVINDTTGGQTIKVVGAGPTTGVTLANGERALIAWNGSDFVKVGTNFAAGGSTTQVQYNSSGALAGSANLTFDGTTLTANSAAVSTGNLTFSGTAQRITGDMSNATQANRLAFQSSTVNGNTALHVLPNGTSTVGSYIAFNNSDPTNAAFIQIQANGSTEARVNSSITGTGTYLPMTFYTGGSERVRVDTSGNVAVGTTNAGTAGLSLSQNYNLSWEQSSTESVANLFRQTSSAALVMSVGYKRSATANGFASSFGSSLAKTAISLGTTAGAITFYTDTAATTAVGTDVTPTERMRIDSSGNVGIGTASPGYRLDVRAASGSANIESTTTTNITYLNFKSVGFNYVGVESSTGGSLFTGTAAYSAVLGTVSAYPVALATNGAERMRIDSSGNVGIGTASPGDRLDVVGGNIRIASGNTVRWVDAGNIRASIQGDSSSNAIFSTAGSERLRIDSSGNVGIGTASPSSYGRLGVMTPTANNGFFGIANSAGGAGGVQMAQYYSTVKISYIDTTLTNGTPGSETAYLAFATANSGTLAERMRIDSSGNLLVGTTGSLVSAVSRFRVSASSAPAVDAKTTAAADAVVDEWNSATAGDNTFERFWTEGTATLRGSIDYNRAGGLVRYNTTSDYRAKDIIGPVTNPGAVIDALKVYEGRMKGATQTRPMLVAHEAQEVTPYAVSGVKDEVNPDGTPKFQQIDVSSLVPLLLAEMQSLRARVAQLERQP